MAYRMRMLPELDMHALRDLDEAGRVYLNHAAVAPMSLACRMRMREMLDAQAAQPLSAAPYKWVQMARADAARLLGGGEDGKVSPFDIAFVPNTSSGLSMMALCGPRGRPWMAGDHAVCLAGEFASNVMPWQRLSAQGVSVTTVQPHAHGLYRMHDIIEAIRDDTRMVALPWVHFATGQRLDVARVAEVAHAAGAIVIVDAIQGLGALKVDVTELGCDALVAGGHKWLLGPEGTGVMWVHPDLSPQLTPPLTGWMSRRKRLDFDADGGEPPMDARRFEPGTWNVIGLAGLGASLRALLEIGVDAVEARALALAAQGREALREAGLQVVEPWKPAGRSAIVAAQLPDGVDGSEVVKQLAAQGIDLGCRQGLLRISAHVTNTAEEMEKLSEALKGCF